jgi:mRNA interferase MazF
MVKISMKRGEIWLINLAPTVGAEIKKTRPAIIVNDNELGVLPLRIIVPLTDWKEKYDVADWMVKIEPNTLNNLTKNSAADCFQLRSVSKDRFIKKVGKVSSGDLSAIEVALATVLQLK